MVDEEIILEEEVVTLEQLKQKLIESGAKRIEIIEKRGGLLNNIISTIEIWQIDDSDEPEEAIIWIKGDIFKFFGKETIEF